MAGTFVTLAATASGAPAFQYQFWLSTDAGLTYALAQDWSVAATWTTPAALGAGTYRIRVDARTDPTAPPVEAILDLVLAPAPGAPFIASVTPASGSTAGATTVTIAGGNFVPGTIVTVAGVPQQVVSVAPGAVTIVTSPGAAGPAEIAVVTPSNQAAILPGGYDYTAPARTPPPPPPPPPLGPQPPATGVTLAAALPSPQLAGTFVPFVAAGTGSAGYAYRFWLSADAGATFALAQDWSAATTWTTPAALPAGTYRIRVEVGTTPGTVDAQATLDFALAPAPPAPLVTSLSPRSGSTAGSTTVVIAGASFLPGVVVRLGGRPQTVLSVTPAAVTIVTAAAVAGLADVEVLNPTNDAAILPGGYDYILPVR